MCLAIPARVLGLLPGQLALVDVAGTRREVSVQLVDDVSVGDYLTVNLGFALHRIDAAYAEESLALFRELAAALR